MTDIMELAERIVREGPSSWPGDRDKRELAKALLSYRWVSVDNELPIEGKKVLVLNKFWPYEIKEAVLYRDEGGWFWGEPQEEGIDVEHEYWMPLPPTPQVDEQEFKPTASPYDLNGKKEYPGE